MKKNVKRIVRSIKNLEVVKKTWSIYQNRRLNLALFDDYEQESQEYGYEAATAHIKLYDCEIKRLRSIIAC